MLSLEAGSRASDRASAYTSHLSPKCIEGALNSDYASFDSNINPIPENQKENGAYVTEAFEQCGRYSSCDLVLHKIWRNIERFGQASWMSPLLYQRASIRKGTRLPKAMGHGSLNPSLIPDLTSESNMSFGDIENWHPDVMSLCGMPATHTGRMTALTGILKSGCQWLAVHGYT
ncbi:hypothetical protein BDP55DRAFT_638787 [Colletotrichum godetiae]|uniref:Uncharacterized protein n=1 Tax=Colletotrichum godetiae TaxID=1209918 RepID=A0AAJ0A6H2_9PEZI|nr:uncharacterized protein BDP55DRAFT_638787 [Colletotrichum godetiae]KAK1657388.1 hypothetical protein BDP55DRAFT_638787 [Colletotrichum godetiae]